VDDFQSGQINVTAGADSSAPALLPVKFFVRELKNTRPIRPSARMRPEPPSWADDRAAKRADVIFEKQRYYNKIKALSR